MPRIIGGGSCKAGDHDAVLNAQFSLGALRIAAKKVTLPVVLKEALRMIGLGCGLCHEPIEPQSGAGRADVRKVLVSMHMQYCNILH